MQRCQWQSIFVRKIRRSENTSTAGHSHFVDLGVFIDLSSDQTRELALYTLIGNTETAFFFNKYYSPNSDGSNIVDAHYCRVSLPFFLALLTLCGVTDDATGVVLGHQCFRQKLSIELR